MVSFNLEKVVDPCNITQPLVSPSYMIKACFINPVKRTFSIALFKTIVNVLFLRPTDFSRFNNIRRILWLDYLFLRTLFLNV